MLSPAKSDAIIAFDDVCFTYDGVHNALDGITLNIAEGEFVCILGGNGSGKSTLAKHINALLVPDSGAVHVCGHSTADPDSVDFIRSNAGMVFQNPDDQMVTSIVEEEVAFGPENLQLPPEELRVRVSTALQEVGMQGFERHETNSLSGGQKQRISIASALAMKPKILVLDEATSMLDPRGRHGLLKECQKLNLQGMTIVLITHFMGEAALGERVIVLDKGKIAMDGKPEDVLKQAKSLRNLHLDAPFPVRMSMKLQDAGLNVPVVVNENNLVEELKKIIPEKAELQSELIFPKNWEDVNQEAREAREAREAAYANNSAQCNQNRAVIQFEDVWFSYVPKSHLKKLLRSGRVQQKQDRRSSDFVEQKWGSVPDTIWALSNISLSVYEGEVLGIIGHTGSGKSTLMQLAAGISVPTRGEVLMNGKSSAGRKGAIDAQEGIGVVFQRPENQLFAETVFDDVAFGPRNLGLPEAEVKSRVQDALLLMGLHDRKLWKKSPFLLSGGQQRRVAIAGVLAMGPRTLILDEPAVGLDPLSHRSLMQLIRKLHDEHNMTIVMVSHDMRDVAHLCTRVIALDKGSICLEGAPVSVFADAEHMKQIGLSLPNVLRLAEELGFANFAHVPTEDELVRLIVRAVDENTSCRGDLR